MPFLIPLIPAAIGAAGSIVGNAIAANSAASQQQQQQAAAQAAAAANTAAAAPQLQAAQGANASEQSLAAETAAGTGVAQGATNAIGQQQGFVNALQGGQGLQNQSTAGQNLSSTYNQLQNVASGQGPNPAMAALNQQTGTNVANQAALMAGQRGAGANVGLEARQAAQQGAATQQQAVGQGATLQAQQSLNALGQQAGVAGQQAGLGATQVGQQQAGITQLTGAQQQQENLANTAAAQSASNAQGLYGAQTGAANTAQNIQQGGINAQQEGIAAQQANLSKGIAGATAGAGTALAAMVPSPSNTPSTDANFTMPTTGVVAPQTSTTSQLSTGQGASGLNLTLAHGGSVPQSNPKLEQSRLDPSDKSPRSLLHKHMNERASMAFAKGGDAQGKVPGKAKVTGKKDSLKNDVVPAMLSPGEIVIPRSITQSSDAARKSAEFVARVLARKGKK